MSSIRVHVDFTDTIDTAKALQVLLEANAPFEVCEPVARFLVEGVTSQLDRVHAARAARAIDSPCAPGSGLGLALEEQHSGAVGSDDLVDVTPSLGGTVVQLTEPLVLGVDVDGPVRGLGHDDLLLSGDTAEGRAAGDSVVPQSPTITQLTKWLEWADKDSENLAATIRELAPHASIDGHDPVSAALRFHETRMGRHPVVAPDGAPA